jgi:hypothetical protein
MYAIVFLVDLIAREIYEARRWREDKMREEGTRGTRSL